MKKMILVVSPPACGKTFVSKKIAETLEHIIYLDKDTLIPLSKKIFEVANEEYNRSSPFFNKWIRDVEYEVILDLAFEALEYDNLVLVNAPFTKEIRDVDYIKSLANKLKLYQAELYFVWVIASPETCHKRMIQRNSTRDTWKLAHWDEYISGVNFEIPEAIHGNDTGAKLLVFDNDSSETFDHNLREICDRLEND